MKKEINIPHIILDKTTSTIEVASKINVENDFFAILAKEQLNGRGRFSERKWISPQNLGVYLSVIINDTSSLTPEALLYVTKATALSVIYTINNIFSEIDLKIKEPNDIFSEKGKICGVLAESKTKGNVVEKLIVSYGLNLIRPEKLPVDLPENTGFLSDFFDIKLIKESKIDIINTSIDNIKKFYKKLVEQKFNDIDKNFNSFLL